MPTLEKPPYAGLFLEPAWPDDVEDDFLDEDADIDEP